MDEAITRLGLELDLRDKKYIRRPRSNNKSRTSPIISGNFDELTAIPWVDCVVFCSGCVVAGVVVTAGVSLVVCETIPVEVEAVSVVDVSVVEGVVAEVVVVDGVVVEGVVVEVIAVEGVVV